MADFFALPLSAQQALEAQFPDGPPPVEEARKLIKKAKDDADAAAAGTATGGTDTATALAQAKAKDTAGGTATDTDGSGEPYPADVMADFFALPLSAQQALEAQFPDGPPPVEEARKLIKKAKDDADAAAAGTATGGSTTGGTATDGTTTA